LETKPRPAIIDHRKLILLLRFKQPSTPAMLSLSSLTAVVVAMLLVLRDASAFVSPLPLSRQTVGFVLRRV